MKKGKNLFIELAFIVLIVILANLILGELLIRFDLTRDKRYVLSKDTKSIVRGLDDEVFMEFYISRNIPANIVNLKKEILDVLKEYKIVSKGRIRIKETDPMSNTDIERRLYMYGISPVSVNVFQKDKAEVVKTYIAISVFYKDKVESIPFVQNINELEYKLTSILLKITSPKVFVVGYPQEGPEFDLSAAGADLTGELAKQYKVVPVSLRRQADLDNLDLLIVPNYKHDLPDLELYNLDQFIVKGGKTAFFINGVNIDFEADSKANLSNLFQLLRSKNITVNHDLVNDYSNEVIVFSDGRQQLAAPYPQFVKVLNENMNKSYSSLKNLASVTLPWTSTLSFSNDDLSGFDIIMKTTMRAWLTKRDYTIDPTKLSPPQDPGMLGQFILCGMQYGKFRSFYKEENIPRNIDASSFVETGENETRILVVGTSHFLKDNVLKRFTNNKVFFLNIIDSMLLGDKLADIRTKITTEPAIRSLSDGAKLTIKYLNFLLMPLIVVVYGLIRFISRKNKGKAAEEKNEAL